jgi:hypothetical protein
LRPRSGCPIRTARDASGYAFAAAVPFLRFRSAEQPPPALGVMPEDPPPPPIAASRLPPAPPRPPIPLEPRGGDRDQSPVCWLSWWLGFWLVRQIGKRNANKAARHRTAVEVDIATTPPGASVRVTAAGAAAIPGHLHIQLQAGAAPDTYQVVASLDGYEPAAAVVTVTARRPAAVGLTLQPLAQSVRVMSDLDQGKVS